MLSLILGRSNRLNGEERLNRKVSFPGRLYL
jgi:hypothetical protein